MSDPSTWEKSITVTRQHLDELGHVNNVVYLQWIQDIAREHWLVRADQGIQRQVIWVVTRHVIDYKLACLAREVLTLRTETAPEIHGPLWDRYVQIYKPGLQLAVSATTTWCLLDRNTLKIKRITPEIRGVFRKERT